MSIKSKCSKTEITILVAQIKRMKYKCGCFLSLTLCVCVGGGGGLFGHPSDVLEIPFLMCQ